MIPEEDRIAREEVERVSALLIAARFSDPDSVRALGLTAADFPRPSHRAFWEAADEVEKRGEPVTPAAIAEALNGRFEAFGGWKVLSRCVEPIPKDVPLAHLASVLREEAVLLKEVAEAWAEALQGTDVASDAERGGPAPDSEATTTTASVTLGVNLTDVGNAARFVRDHGERLRYVHDFGAWFIYTGSHWQRDETGEVLRLARQTAAGMLGEAAAIQDDETRKATARHALRTENRSRLEAMVSLAQSDRRVAITQAALDTDPWLLTVRNGTLDLRVPDLREHRAADLITHCLPVPYDMEAECPTWSRFLDRIFENNRDLIGFLQRALGYTLTGHTREEALFLLLGRGENGKTTLLEAFRSLVQPLARSAAFETFLDSKAKSGQIPNDVARLRGARFVTAVEADGERRFSEAIIKKMTSTDTITARFLNQEFFEFKPTFKLWLAANHRPIIRGTDHAIWRRIRLIPFNVTITKEERDENLADKLRAEHAGMLAWAVAGAYYWRTEGLGQAEAVTNATESYRADMDALGGFIEECCEVGPAFKASSADLYAAYKVWAERAGETVMTQRTLILRLRERDEIERLKPCKVGEGRGWSGIGVKPVKPPMTI